MNMVQGNEKWSSTDDGTSWNLKWYFEKAHFFRFDHIFEF